MPVCKDRAIPKVQPLPDAARAVASERLGSAVELLWAEKPGLAEELGPGPHGGRPFDDGRIPPGALQRGTDGHDTVVLEQSGGPVAESSKKLLTQLLGPRRRVGRDPHRPTYKGEHVMGRGKLAGHH